MIAGSGLFKQGARYYEWIPVTHPNLDRPRTIKMDANRVFYVSTWNGDVVKSSDHGLTWIKCTKPYPDNPYYIYMQLANDNSIWVFKFEYPVKFSADGGITWLTAGSGLEANGLGDVFRMKNGSLFYHGSNCCSLHRSDDNGLTWTKINNTPPWSYRLFVSDKDEIYLICHPAHVYRSKDMGASFEYIFPFSPEWITTNESNIYTRWKDFYYVAIPGYGISVTRDLEKYDPYFISSRVLDLFIDHNGVLMVRDQDYNSVWYRQNTE
jgi:photosystem II stability/assembly factor-like uncharacterized protein